MVSQPASDFDNPVPVKLQDSETIFKIRHEDTGKYLGLAVLPALHDLLASYTIEFKAFVSVVKTNKLLTKSKKAESSLYNPPEFSLRVVVFGLSEDTTAVGAFFAMSKLYLQHPSRTECDLGVDYFNPHYLVRAGGEMPGIEELSLSDDEEEKKNYDYGYSR
ncbi:hypothetical protein E0Z10_g9160 [Xylaria hypoxylon]|uniref:Uncharacterized protein n=1 Tax=Xylaria hypoxylon TaxID=37992 RepID=A0A4Z0YHY8_9PEZI|nr:hypothetical protein E0Z10_g9160 [Xylaria hypoxylon]